MNTQFYTTNDVAEILKFSPKTIRDWCGRGVFPGAEKYPSNTRGAEWRIPAQDVEAIKRRQATTEPISRDRLDQLMDAALAKSA